MRAQDTPTCKAKSSSVSPRHANLNRSELANESTVWGSFCFVCIFFVWFLIYETKGLSLEQVDELYGTISKAWQSKRFKPTISFQEVEEVDGAKRGMSLSEIGAEVERKKSVGHVEGYAVEK